MKFLMDEHVKHRLIGLAVIVSIAAIFAPAVIKKSNQRLDEHVNVSLKLPTKPTPTKVVIPEEKEMLETIKVAHVEIPEVPNALDDATFPKAESLSDMNQFKETVHSMAEKAKTAPIKLIKEKPVMVAAATKGVTQQQRLQQAQAKPIASIKAVSMKKVTSMPIKITKGYVVQLGMFSKQKNAEALIAKLKTKGYRASYRKVTSSRGQMVYKVIVGQGNPKDKAELMQQKLASSMKISGLVVRSEVG